MYPYPIPMIYQMMPPIPYMYLYMMPQMMPQMLQMPGGSRRVPRRPPVVPSPAATSEPVPLGTEAVTRSTTETTTPPWQAFVIGQTSSAKPEMIKWLKRTQTLGCEKFKGTKEAEEARDWLRMMKHAFEDMGLEGDGRVAIVERFLEGTARVWWDRVKDSYTTLITWDTFITEFNTQYYTRYYQEQKRREFSSFR